jgi:hypothetical protein
MPQSVLTGNKNLIGQAYPEIPAKLIIEIKQGATWEEPLLFPGDLRGGTFGFYIAPKYGQLRTLDIQFDTITFGDFIVNGQNLADHSRLILTISPNLTKLLEVTPVATKKISAPVAGRDFWQADLEWIGTGEIPIRTFFDLVPVVVRGQV